MSANEDNLVIAPQQPRRAENIIVPEHLNEDVVVNGVQELEDALTLLQVHVENGEWDDAMDRVRSHPEEIMPTRSQGGCGRALTALHLACEGGECPLPLMRAMLARRPQVAAMVDRDGNTPLHNACAGNFAYDPVAICLLLIAYPQAVLIQDKIELTTPLHLLLILGGNVNLTCVQLLLDVAYSAVAGLPRTYVPQQDFCGLDLASSLLVAANYPPVVIQQIRELAIGDPFSFPKYLHPFIQLPAPSTLDVDPQLVDGQAKLLLLQECKLQTPLHSACARGVGTDVIRLLINESRYPGAHEAAKIKDRKDRDPLFYAAVYCLPHDGIKLIYDLNPGAVVRYDSYRVLPLHVTYISPPHSHKDRELKLKIMRQDDSQRIEDCFELQTATQLWRTYELFLRLTYHLSYQDPPPGCSHWRILHALGSIPSPPHFMRAAIKLHPWQLRERDEDGYTPLQRAAMCKRPEGIDENQYWLPKGINQKALYPRCHSENREKDNTVSVFVEACPDMARVVDKDMKLPLHWAIETGKEWNEGIHSLVNAAPLALGSRDGDSHMYPFMMAASKGNLSLTLNLLLSNPMMVQSGISYDADVLSRAPSLRCEDFPVKKKPKLAQTHKLSIEQKCVS